MGPEQAACQLDLVPPVCCRIPRYVPHFVIDLDQLRERNGALQDATR
jgi:hypothetical protein